MRRRADRERVQATLIDTVACDWGEEIVRLRKAMNTAVGELYAGEPERARLLLSAALAERWWR